MRCARANHACARAISPSRHQPKAGPKRGAGRGQLAAFLQVQVVQALRRFKQRAVIPAQPGCDGHQLQIVGTQRALAILAANASYGIHPRLYGVASPRVRQHRADRVRCFRLALPLRRDAGSVAESLAGARRACSVGFR